MKVQCRFCNWTKAKNPSRQLDHIKTCVPYLTAMTEAGKHTTIAQKSQQRLLAIGKSSSQREKANFLLAMAIFSGARPFTLFADQDMLAFLQALDPTFCPPSRDTIRTRLLDD